MGLVLLALGWVFTGAAFAILGNSDKLKTKLVSGAICGLAVVMCCWAVRLTTVMAPLDLALIMLPSILYAIVLLHRAPKGLCLGAGAASIISIGTVLARMIGVI